MKTKIKNRRIICAAVSSLLLFALACSATGPATQAPEVGEAQPTQSAPPAATTAPTPGSAAAPAPTDTPAPDVPGPGGCNLNGAYVADVTIPDGTELPPGKPFTKAWRVRNTGSCPWEAGTRLVFISGDQMGAPAAVSVEPVAPGSGTRIGVDMIAPASPGNYRGDWQLQSPDGVNYGSVVYVAIVVPAAPAPTATPTGGGAPASPTSTPETQETHLTIQLDADNSASSDSTQARAGDDPNDSRVVGYLSWDLSTIPAGATIVSAEIVWGTQCFRGGDVGDCSSPRNPFPVLGHDRLGYLDIQHYHYGDLNNPPTVLLDPALVSPFQVYSSQPTGRLDVTAQVADDLAAGNDLQLRITFQNNTFDGGIGNGIIFVEGSGPNKLEVVYTMP